MEELKLRVIPIVIKRTLPNGDYQNISLEQISIDQSSIKFKRLEILVNIK